MSGVDIVFNLVVMKYVLFCEYNFIEVIKINVMGMENVIKVVINNDVECVIFISLDKVINFLNIYGVIKLLVEKLV